MNLTGSARQTAADWGYGAAWRAVRGIPERIAQPIFEAAAEVATRRDGRGVGQLRRNLARVVGRSPADPALQDLVRSAMRSYARYWLETFRLPSMQADSVVARVNMVGNEHIEQACSDGRGVILALPHSGNWDVAGLWLVLQGHPFTTVVERLQPESLFNKFVAYRESLGMEVLALTGGDVAPLSVLRNRLESGGVVCLVADRDLSRNGVDVEFFGETARMPGGPSMLAAMTGAALLPAHLCFTDDGWGQRVGAPVDLGGGPLRSRIRKGTQSLADFFAAGISDHPQDWHMLQRLWTADLDRSAPISEAAV